MKITLQKDRFDAIDHCFAQLNESTKNINSVFQSMEKILKETFHKNIKLVLIKAKKGDPFFVMSIFPDESTIDRLVEAIVNEEQDQIIKKIWDETDNWTIEIDTRLFNDDYVRLTSKELTALLLHEIGHMVYSNSIPQRISRVMRLEYATANIEVKAVMKKPMFRKVLSLPILNACTYDNYKTKDRIKNELKADVFVVKMGYGKELESALSKFIGANDTNVGDHINKDSGDVYDDMKQVTLFSIGIIEDFKDRKAAIGKKKVLDMLTRVPSNFINSFVTSISGLFSSPKGGMNETQVLEFVQESAQKAVDEMYMKEFFDFKWKKLKRIDPAVIDYIDVQKDAIKSNNDRMLLLNYIHTKLDTVEYYINILKSPKYSKKYDVPHTMEQLLSYKSRLEQCRDYVLSVRIPDYHRGYVLNIDYPPGYEG